MFSLPAVALEDKEIFKSLFTKDVWDNVISEQDRESLKQYLPSCESDEKLDSLLESLFTSNNRNEFPLGISDISKFLTIYHGLDGEYSVTFFRSQSSEQIS